MTTNPSLCPLCAGQHITPYHQDAHRAYWQCETCALVFVPKDYWLPPQEEKALYDLHDNNPDDPGYRRFLSRLCDPLHQRIPPSQQGLDFGCGPGPTLSIMMEEHGHQMDVYDLFYHKHDDVLKRHYDFICATEVVEHLHNPRKEIARLFSMLRPQGTLGIMTKLVLNPTAFSTWHYIQDPTHISFFSQATFQLIAQWYDAEVSIIGNDVILLRKN